MKKKYIILIAVLLSVSLPTIAQTRNAPLKEMDDETLFRTVTRELSDDKFGGRKPLTPYEAPTLDYISAKFKEVGLEPAAGGSYLQKVPLLGVMTHLKNNEMVVTGAKKTVRLRNWDDIVVWTLRAEKQLKVNKADFVFVGFGINAPEYGWNDYAGVDVKGILRSAIICVII